MSNQTGGVDQTTFDQQIAALQASILAGGAAGQNPMLPTPVGVPKYRVGPDGEVAKDAQGHPIPWTTTGQRGGVYDSSPGATSRVDNPPQVPAKYYSHDAYTVVDGLASEDVYKTQRLLIDAGLLKPAGVVSGNWTAKEASAMNEVLSVANNSGVTWDVALAHMAANGRLHPAAATQVTRPSIDIQKANPYALGQVADTVATKMLGRRLSDAERGKFVEWWGQQEDKANAEKVAVSNSEANDLMNKGGDTQNPNDPLHQQTSRSSGPPDLSPQVAVGVHTTTAQLTPAEAAQQFVQQQNPGEASTHDQLNTFNDFLSIMSTKLGGGIPGRPGA